MALPNRESGAQPGRTDTASETETGPAGAPTEGGEAPALSFGELVRRVGPAGPMALIAGSLPAIGSIFLFMYINAIGEWLRSHGTSGVLIYTAGFVLFTGFALLPTYATAILGGWAFGFASAFPAVIVGFAAAAGLGYATGRLGARDRVTDLIAEKPKWQAVRDALLGGTRLKAFAIITLLRLPPNSPFALTNLVLASVRTPLWLYFLGTIVGMTPRTAVVLYFAATLRERAASEAASAKPWWWIPLAIGATLAVLFVLWAIGHHAIQRLVPGTRAERSGEAKS